MLSVLDRNEKGVCCLFAFDSTDADPKDIKDYDPEAAGNRTEVWAIEIF